MKTRDLELQLIANPRFVSPTGERVEVTPDMMGGPAGGLQPLDDDVLGLSTPGGMRPAMGDDGRPRTGLPDFAG